MHDPDGSSQRHRSCAVVSPGMGGDSSAEVDFLTRASNSNLFAIEKSRLAIDRTRNSRLKTFARQMVKDHGVAQSELQVAAKGSGAAAPTTLDQGHQARLKALRSKSGADFDKAYVANQGENHSNALTLYGDYMLWASTRSFTLWRSRSFRSRKRSSRQSRSSLATDRRSTAPALADARRFAILAPRRASVHGGKSGHHRLRHRLGRRQDRGRDGLTPTSLRNEKDWNCTSGRRRLRTSSCLRGEAMSSSPTCTGTCVLSSHARRRAWSIARTVGGGTRVARPGKKSRPKFCRGAASSPWAAAKWCSISSSPSASMAFTCRARMGSNSPADGRSSPPATAA